MFHPLDNTFQFGAQLLQMGISIGPVTLNGIV